MQRLAERYLRPCDERSPEQDTMKLRNSGIRCRTSHCGFCQRACGVELLGEGRQGGLGKGDDIQHMKSDAKKKDDV